MLAGTTKSCQKIHDILHSTYGRTVKRHLKVAFGAVWFDEDINKLFKCTLENDQSTSRNFINTCSSQLFREYKFLGRTESIIATDYYLYVNADGVR